MSGNGGAGDFGGGGSSSHFDCANVSTKTNVTSPDPVVLSTVVVGDILDVRLQTATGPVLAITNAGQTLGSLFIKDLADWIACMNNGNRYKATILSISGGNVQVLITNR